MKTLISSALSVAAIAIVSVAKADGPFYDNFGDARQSAGYIAAEGTVTGTNVGATPQNGEPIRQLEYYATSSVWLKWSARSDCDMFFVAEGAEFGAIMGVYTGTSVGGLTKIAEGNLNGALENSSECTFRATKGTTYFVCISGRDGETGQIKLRWAKEPPPNGPLYDDFGGARTSQGSAAASGSVTGRNVGATPQNGEPWMSSSFYGSAKTTTVWFKWKAPATGATKFSATGTGFTTMMEVFTGTSVGSLQRRNSTITESRTDTLTILADKGVTYFVCIGGYNGATGPITLTWGKEPKPNGPLYDDFGSARTSQGYTGDNGELTGGRTVGATPQKGEPLPKHSADLTSTVWFKWKAPYTADMMFSTRTSNGGRYDMGVYTGTSVGSLTVIREGNELELTPGFDAYFSDWHIPEPDGVLLFRAVRGTTYFICIAGRDGQIDYDVAVSWECWQKCDPPNGPLYDDFGGARTSQGYASSSGVVVGKSYGATAQNGEPLRYHWPSATATVWLKWKATFSGTVEFSTDGSDFYPVMGVYKGDSVGSLLMRTINDTGRCLFAVEAGEQYFICVAGADGEEGTIRLSWASWGLNGPDLFDSFGGARTSKGSNAASGSVSGTNDGATLENGEPLKKYSAKVRGTVWFKWIAPATRNMQFDGTIYSGGTTRDSVMGVYTGTSVGHLTKVAENDDSSTESKWARVNFAATKGQTYYICVGDGGQASDIGEVSIEWRAAQ